VSEWVFRKGLKSFLDVGGDVYAMDGGSALRSVSAWLWRVPVVRCAGSASGSVSGLAVERCGEVVLGGFHDAGAALLARFAI
jgi:hypothetical protein